MSRRDRVLTKQLDTDLQSFTEHELPGIQSQANRQSLVEQLIESIHRVGYITAIRNRDISPQRANPASELFDPLKAAILHQRAGDIDEACWLVFLFVHFGKHLKDGWLLIREVYKGRGNGRYWNWDNTSSNPNNFRNWLEAYQERLKTNGIKRRFGNHRKYESLDARSHAGTGTVIESYISWVAPPRTHQDVFSEALQTTNQDSRAAFDNLYNSMQEVHRFGRTARFDYLAMIGKLGLAGIEPGSPYLNGATGPLAGARLLFSGGKEADISVRYLSLQTIQLGNHLNVGMQIMEDALCNWQKSPERFRRFRG